MRDDELRSLERELAASGSVAARLAYARALERLDRRDEAQDVLAPGREDASVRRELGRFPAWSRAEAGPSGSRWTDVRPLSRQPRVRWRWTAPGTARGEPQLLSSPLGAVVAVSLDREVPPRATVLSPDGTPVRSWDRERGAAPLALEQGLVLDPRGAGVFAVDPVTGDERILVPRAPGLLTAEAACARGLVLVPEEDDLRAHELAAGECASAWTVARPRTAVFRTAPHTHATATRVYLSAPGFGRGGVFTAFERATGAELWRSQRLLAADDAGGLALEAGGLVAVGPGGERLWDASPESVATVHVLAPALVLAEVTDSGLKVVLDRANGGVRPERPVAQGARVVAAARDVLYSVERAWEGEGGRELAHPREIVTATSLEGEARWRLELEWERGVVLALAPAPGRLYVLTSEASVLCLEEPA